MEQVQIQPSMRALLFCVRRWYSVIAFNAYFVKGKTLQVCSKDIKALARASSDVSDFFDTGLDIPSISQIHNTEVPRNIQRYLVFELLLKFSQGYQS